MPTLTDLFAIRLRLYSVDGNGYPTVRGRILKTLACTFTTVADEAAVLQFSTSAAVTGTLPLTFYVGVEYRSSTGWVSPVNDLFIVEEDESDRKDAAAVTPHTGVLWVADRAAAYHVGVTGATDGAVTWQNASAGAVVADVLSQHPGIGITRTFTPAVDSNGNAWPVADQQNQTFRQYATIGSVLSSLASGAFCQWSAQGTELILEVAGTGTDRSQGEGAVLVGPGAKSNKRKRSTRGTATQFLVVTDNPNVPTQLVTRPELGAGQRQAIVTVSGAPDSATALRMAQPLIDQAAQIKEERTVDYDAPLLPARPFEDFNVRDVLDVDGTPYRLIGMQVTTGETTTVRLTFGSRFLALTTKLAQRTARLSLGSLSLTAGSGDPITPGVVVTTAPPLAPTGLRIVSNVGMVRDNGESYASIQLAWDPVTETVYGADTHVTEYEVWVRTGEETLVPQVTVDTNEVTVEWWGEPRTVRVRAYNGQWSTFSDELLVTPQPPVQVVDPPTAPQVVLGPGIAAISWDGSLVTGAPPASFWHLFAETAPIGGEWTRIGVPAEQAGQVALIRGEVGLEARVRFVWADTLGRESNPSQEELIQFIGLSPGDLESIPDFFAHEAIIEQLRVQVLRAGSINVDMLAPDVGQRIDIVANEGLAIITDRLDEVEEATQYYRFGPDGAIIGREGDPTTFEFRNDGASFSINGVEATTWGPEGMDVDRLLADEATLANHRFEKSGSRTIVRWAGAE